MPTKRDLRMTMWRWCAALFCLAAWLGAPQRLIASGFLHADGVNNLDNNDRPIVLHGVDLGCWLWPEYYMMGSPDLSAYANAGTGSGGIANYYDGWVAAIKDVLGGDTNLTAQVMEAYWSDFITAPDIVFLHTNGFNSVRVPYSFEEFFQVTNWANHYPSNGYDISVGFKYLDNLAACCSTNSIYVIPDMHCAPGGPNNFSVTNYGGTLNTNTASVFASAPNLALAEHIWSRIAAHYATNSWIGGYDLLNDPVNTSVAGGQVGSPALSDTYASLARAIRAVDTNHVIICEGDDYATTFWDAANTGWTDSNRAFSDHDYGSSLPLGTGNRAYCVGANAPIWAGEFGINSTHWLNKIVFGTYQQPVTLSQNGHAATITEGTCFWAYKYCGQCYGLVQNAQTPGWNALMAYWAGNAPKPSVTNAFSWLMSYAHGTLFSNCIIHPETLDALARIPRSFTNSMAAYAPNAAIPGRIFAVDYDMGDEGVAYADTVFDDEANRGPSGTAWNNGWFGRCDGVDTTTCSDTGTLLKVGWNDAGEWQRHSLTCQPGVYNITIRYASAGGGQLDLSLLMLNPLNSIVTAGNDLTGAISLPSTGSYTSYSSYTVPSVVLSNSGKTTLQITCVNSGYDLVWVDFTPANGPPLPPAPERAPIAGTSSFSGVQCAPGPGAVSLQWTPCVDAAGYRVKRSTTRGGPYSLAGETAAASFLDTGLANNVNYYYVVAATNANGEGADSLETSAMPAPSSLPLGWADRDVGLAALWDGSAGDVGFPGSSSFDGSAFTVSASGVDVWGNADSFHDDFRQCSGDSTNIVRVATLQNTDPWAKAGLMIRESLNPDSLDAFISITGQNGALFSWRNASGAASSSANVTGVGAPQYVKLTRQQNTFAAYISANGVTWRAVGAPILINMAGHAFVGLAVTAHNNLTFNTSAFDNLSILDPTSETPLPLLSSYFLNNAITLSWPNTATTTWLQTTTNLTPPILLTAVTNNIAFTNYANTVTLATANQRRFFRLAIH